MEREFVLETISSTNNETKYNIIVWRKREGGGKGSVDITSSIYDLTKGEFKKVIDLLHVNNV